MACILMSISSPLCRCQEISEILQGEEGWCLPLGLHCIIYYENPHACWCLCTLQSTHMEFQERMDLALINLHLWSLLLNNGITLAILSSFGKMPWVEDHNCSAMRQKSLKVQMLVIFVCFLSFHQWTPFFWLDTWCIAWLFIKSLYYFSYISWG